MDNGITIFPIRGVIQDYAWGGKHYIPALLGSDNPEGRPQAELWMGAHPRGAARVLGQPESAPLDQLISRRPTALLGAAIDRRFAHQLPFLFKILDVERMLSIQVHPSKAAAEAGFRRENEAGIPLDAPHRNYKDDNHKPEVVVALTEFWLLHGFKPLAEMEETLAKAPEFQALRAHFPTGSIYDLYRFIMELPQTAVDRILAPLWQRLQPLAGAGQLSMDTADYWAAQAFQDYTTDGHYDRGIFSIYLFNLVRLAPGQGIFQAAGVPHAYLRGVNVELMANSDNVFRGGLTPKHIDVPELLQHLVFEPVTPAILEGKAGLTHETVFPTPAPDFVLSRLALPAGERFLIRSANGPSIFIVLEGEISVRSKENSLPFARGGQFFVGHGANLELIAGSKPAILYRAAVPV